MNSAFIITDPSGKSVDSTKMQHRKKCIKPQQLNGEVQHSQKVMPSSAKIVDLNI
jgi:hypothetical protein